MAELRRELAEKEHVLAVLEGAMKGGPMPQYEVVVAKWAEVHRSVSGFELAAVVEAHQVLQSVSVSAEVVNATPTGLGRGKGGASPALKALLEK